MPDKLTGAGPLDFAVERLGPCEIPSPHATQRYVSESRRVLFHGDPADLRPYIDAGLEPPAMEAAGPRQQIFFNPAGLKCGILTCGGLCPGINDVIRSTVLSLYHHYGVTEVYGFMNGYEGLTARYAPEALRLTPQMVADINRVGGTFLGSSRGPQDVGEMVDTLERLGIGVLFTIGGDGTLRGAATISEEIERRRLRISVIGIPKTIDNDISYIDRSFGFFTAGAEARKAVMAAHNEARGYRNGVAVVKLMGREAGFIAAYAAITASEVNFCLVPEVPFTMNAFLKALKERLVNRGHAVVVVAEGAGRNIMSGEEELDASGNIRYGDVGIVLRDRIKDYFNEIGMTLNLKYIDPSYTIRSVLAEADDSGYCLLLGFQAVHAAMSGRTNMVVGHWRNQFTHVPIPLAVSQRKKIEEHGWLWENVLALTGQPRNMR